MRLVIRNARVLTLGHAPRPRRGTDLGTVCALDPADVLVDGTTVSRVGSGIESRPGDRELDAGGRVLMPGFVDCHTHACWAGDRLDEWEMKLRGLGYLEILAAGGGIIATVRAVRRASEEQLADLLLERLERMLALGTTTVEVKSGYGLTTTDELKMLRAIRRAADRFPGTVVPTALLGHALDPEQPDLVTTTIGETLPAVSSEFPGIAVDAYCERGAWCLDDCLRLFERARELAHPIRVHADQFNPLGMTSGAVRIGARSVDHLEASLPAELGALAASASYGVMLPCCAMHLSGRFADARSFVDHGGMLALATNYNPGSAPCPSMAMVIALAVRQMGLTTSEAIAASTVNPASLLGLDDRGTVAPGQRADLVLLHHDDERQLACEFGAGPVRTVIAGGEIVRGG